MHLLTKIYQTMLRLRQFRDVQCNVTRNGFYVMINLHVWETSDKVP